MNGPTVLRDTCWRILALAQNHDHVIARVVNSLGVNKAS